MLVSVLTVPGDDARALLSPVLQRVQAEASTITLPVLMVHGRADRLAPLSGAQKLYQALGSADKTLKVYDELYHEVCNEPECSMVLSDISDWLEAHL